MKRSYKKSVIMIVVLCMAFLSCGINSFSMDKYNELTVRIPFDFIDSSDAGDDCLVKIECEKDSPKPDSETKKLKDGDFDYFTIKADIPGIYKYKVFEVPGNKDGVFYDDTVYNITIYVTNTDKEDELVYTMTVESSKTGAKPEKVEFKNRNASSERDVPEETPTGDNPAGGSSDSSVNKNTGANSLVTGDNAPILVVIVICVISLFMIIFTIKKKRK